MILLITGIILLSIGYIIIEWFCFKKYRTEGIETKNAHLFIMSVEVRQTNIVYVAN